MSTRSDIMAGRAYVQLYVKQSDFDAELQKASVRVSQLGTQILSVGAKVTGFGAAALSSLIAPVRLASDFEEAFSKFSVVFGDATVAAKQWSDEFAETVGRSRLQIVEFMAGTQDLFVPLGFEPGAATEMSKQLTTLAVDMASFNNMQDTDTLRDLHAALTGSSEVMKKYGVVVNEAAVKQELLNQSIDPRKATEQEKVQARLNIILRGTTAAQGDATRTAGSFANQMKALRAVVSDVAVEVGSALVPALSSIANTFGEIIKPLAGLARENQGVVVSFAAGAAAIAASGAAMLGVGVAAKIAAVGVGVLASVYRVASSAMVIAWAGVSTAFAVLTIKSRIAAKVIQMGWTLASSAVSLAWQSAMGAIGVTMKAAVAALTVAAIAAPWIAGAGLIAVAWLGLDAVLASLAAASAGAWSLAAGTVATTWAATSAFLLPVAAAISGVYTAAAAFVTTAWTAVGGAFAASGAMGALSAAIVAAAWSAVSLLTTAIAVEQSISAAIVAVAWAGASALASLAWSGFTAVMSGVLGFAAAHITASAMIGGAWAVAAFVVSTAWAAAWSVIMSPILPIVAAVGLAVAAVTALGLAAGIGAAQGFAFGKAWEGVKASVIGIFSLMQKVGTAISDALRLGDYQAAVKVLWAGLKVAFFEGALGVLNAFKFMFSEAWEFTKRFFTNLVSYSFKVLKAIALALANPFKAQELFKTIVNSVPSMEFSIGLKVNADEARAELKALQDELSGRAENLKPAEDKKREELDRKVKAGQMTRDDANAEMAAFVGGTTATPKEATVAFDRETQSLQEQIIELRDGEAAAERYRLQMAGLTDEQIRATEALEAEKTALEKSQKLKESRSQDRLKGVFEAGDRLLNRGLSPQEVAAKESAQIRRDEQEGRITKGAADEALLNTQARMVERQRQLQEEGRRLAEEFRTPQEILNAKLRKISQLQDAGTIDPNKAEAAERQARIDFRRDREQEIAKAEAANTQETRQSTPSSVSFSAAALVAQSQGGGVAAQTLTEIKALRDELKMRRQEARDQAREAAAAARAGAGVFA